MECWRLWITCEFYISWIQQKCPQDQSFSLLNYRYASIHRVQLLMSLEHQTCRFLLVRSSPIIPMWHVNQNFICFQKSRQASWEINVDKLYTTTLLVNYHAIRRKQRAQRDKINPTESRNLAKSWPRWIGRTAVLTWSKRQHKMPVKSCWEKLTPKYLTEIRESESSEQYKKYKILTKYL